MEFILQLIGIALIFIGITTIMYRITRDSTKPTWLNIFCASWISIFIVITFLVVMSMTAGAITWEDEKELIQNTTSYQSGIGSIVENLGESKDTKMRTKIQNLLWKYKFSTENENNVFDCTDKSKIVKELLDENGYKTKLMFGGDTRNDINPGMWHMWVVVRDDTDKFIVIETLNQTAIGKVVTKRNNNDQFNYWHGWMLNNSKEYEMTHPKDASEWTKATGMISSRQTA